MTEAALYDHCWACVRTTWNRLENVTAARYDNVYLLQAVET